MVINNFIIRSNAFCVASDIQTVRSLYRCYQYDSLGRFVKSYVYDTETYYNLYESSVVYDEQSRISMVFHNVDYICPSTSYHGNYYYDSTFYSYYYDSVNGRLSSLEITSPSLSGYIDPVYDDLGRATSRVINLNAQAFYNELSYEYVSAAENRQTGLVSAITSTIGSGENAVETEYQYTYDANGNITQIRENNVIQYRYQYDSLGQLVREDNRPLNYSYVYHYDYAGNLTSKVRYAFTTGALGAAQKTDTYTYGDATWGDLLTKFNWDEIEYDEIGNPIKIGSYDEAAGRWDYYYELQWEGRQLKRYEYFELYFDDIYYNDYLVEFTYNADGIRTSKNGRQYLLNGSQIFGEQWKEGRFEHLLIYLYDENGSPIGLKFRKVQYQADVFDCFFFEKNLQGDIIAIYNASGTKIGTYTYDAWGNCTVTTTAGITELESTVVNTYNPFRYRGYYYDVETGFYYLQSRYYNPTWGRFLNADGYVSTGQGLLSYNMYAYCNNNPVMGYDPHGEKTTSFGFSFSFGGFGGGYTGAISLVTDDTGLFAFQWTYSVPNSENTRNTEIGINVGVGLSIQTTNLETVTDLEGKAKSVGVAAGPISVDKITDQHNNDIGYQASIGAGISYSAHVNETNTITIGKTFRGFIRWLEDLFL